MINKDMTIGEITANNEKAVEFLMGHGMGCLGCPSARVEPLEQACSVHGFDVDDMVEQLNNLEK